MSLRVKDKQLLKNHNKIWEKTGKLMRIDFESKAVCSNDDKYIKTSTMQVLINNNARFCS